jgi:hypothetical protein
VEFTALERSQEKPRMKILAKSHRSRIYIGRLTATMSALVLACLLYTGGHVNASAPFGLIYTDLTCIAAAPSGGFWLQRDASKESKPTSSTGTYAIDGAPQFANVPYQGSIAAIPGQEGYWVVTRTGSIFARGTAPELCANNLSNCSGFPKNPSNDQVIMGAAATPDGQGLWAVGHDGKLWTAGTARPYGDVTKQKQIPTGIVATPSGLGYYIVLTDGGVFSFGDAVFYGSTGGKRPNGNDATGLALSLDLTGQVNGYWMVFEDGGVFTFGGAPFLGSSGGNNGGNRVTGITSLPGGHSYAWVHGNGQIDLSETIPIVVITSSSFGTVWGVFDNSTELSAPVQLLTDDGSVSEQWQLLPTDKEKVVQIVNINSGLCADLTSDKRGAFLIQYTCKGKNQVGDNQLFKVITDKDGRTEFAPLGFPNHRLVAMGPSAGLVLQQQGSADAKWILTNTQ